MGTSTRVEIPKLWLTNFWRFEVEKAELKMLWRLSLVGAPHFCEFQLQKPYQVFTVKIWGKKKNCHNHQQDGGRVDILKYAQNLLFLTKPVLKRIYFTKVLPTGVLSEPSWPKGIWREISNSSSLQPILSTKEGWRRGNEKHWWRQNPGDTGWPTKTQT